MTYEEYIASAAWKAKRLERLDIDNHQCQTCCSEDELQVHHKHYRNLFCERMEDLITLCRECHEAITTVIRSRRYSSVVLPVVAIQERLVNDYAKTGDEVEWSCTVDYAQRSVVRSIVEVVEGDEASFVQTLEDRRRP